MASRRNGRGPRGLLAPPLLLLLLPLLAPWPAAGHGGKYSREKNEPERPAQREPAAEFRVEKLNQLWDKARRVSGAGRASGGCRPPGRGRGARARVGRGEPPCARGCRASAWGRGPGAPFKPAGPPSLGAGSWRGAGLRAGDAAKPLRPRPGVLASRSGATSVCARGTPGGAGLSRAFPGAAVERVLEAKGPAAPPGPAPPALCSAPAPPSRPAAGNRCLPRAARPARPAVSSHQPR